MSDNLLRRLAGAKRAEIFALRKQYELIMERPVPHNAEEGIVRAMILAAEAALPYLTGEKA
jgi:hypothetical protein